MTLTKGGLLQPQGMTTIERDLLTLAGADTGRLIFNETTSTLQLWTGTAWADVAVGSVSVAAADITGQLVDAQIAGVSATKLIGQVQDAQIVGMSSSKLIGPVVDTQITSLSASKLTGDISGGFY